MLFTNHNSYKALIMVLPTGPFCALLYCISNDLQYTCHGRLGDCIAIPEVLLMLFFFFKHFKTAGNQSATTFQWSVVGKIVLTIKSSIFSLLRFDCWGVCYSCCDQFIILCNGLKIGEYIWSVPAKEYSINNAWIRTWYQFF